MTNNRLGSLLSNCGLTILLLTFSQHLLRLPFTLLPQATAVAGQLVSPVIYAISMLLTIATARYLVGHDSSIVFPMAPVRHDYLAPAVLSALGIAMLGSLVVTFFTVLLGSVGIYSYQNMPSWNGGTTAVVITILCTTVLPAILEELLFRGLLLQPLRRYGDRLAVVASALLFALAHPTLPQAINAFIVGLALGVLAVRSGSLVAPMVVHFVYNSIACAVSLTATYYPFVGGIVGWLTLVVLIVTGLVAMAILRRRFGVVWWLSRSGEPHLGAWRSAVTSPPLVAAVAFCLIAILRNLYYMPAWGWLP